jgi:ubiquitin carboxyl-terminal hydrolase 5/13
MDLEANLNLTLSKVIEEGKELTPLYGPGCTGMENLGNSCYMNSVVQVLLSMPEFQNRYQEEGPMHLLTC